MCIYSNESSMLLGYNFLYDISDGARIKYYVTKDSITYVYKLSKKHPSGEYTYEHVSELLFKRICDMLSIPCVDITISDRSLLSKIMWLCDINNFIELSEELSHSFHMSNLNTFNVSTLLNEKYNPFCKDIISMLLVDSLCGNSDRHPGNFAYNKLKGFYPLFDNGSSLCAYIKEENLFSFLNDTLRFNSLCVTKSKPVLRDNQKLTHKQLVDIIRTNYPKDFKDFKDKLTCLKTSDLFEGLPISNNRMDLINLFIETRKRWFYE